MSDDGSDAATAGAVDWAALRAAAAEARANAYAPYSRFSVGAALLAVDGRVFRGSNVENASYGLSLCAERAAVAAAVTAGARRFVALALVTGASPPATPCGACRQVLSELPPSFAIRCFGADGDTVDTTVEALLPRAFSRGALDR
ncbi:MAG: cytidine deaminase [Myxococcales bacterium]|nr:cytidine deaminase [Myxococcales bacterium]